MSAYKRVYQILSKEETDHLQRDCTNRQACMKALQLILDGEATPEQLAHFNSNIDRCLPCIESYNLEVTIRQLLCDKIEKKTVPADVIESIKSKISETV